MSARPVWVWCALGIGILMLLAPRGIPARWLGIVWLLPFIFITPSPPTPGQIQFTLLDIGQGLSAVIRTANHTLVYDLGPSFSSGFNSGERVVVPYLRAVGIQQIDQLIISHADNDHAGGLSGLLAGQIPIHQILSGEPQQLTGVTAAFCQRGQHWRWDGVDFEILHPDQPRNNGNDSSCVLKIRTGQFSLLLTGDISSKIETELFRVFGAQLHSNLLIAAHHGSAASSSLQFLQQVAPQWVLYSAGYLNRYRFPTQKVRERVNELGINSLNTATAGAIEFLITPAGIGAPHLARPQSARVWRHVVP